MSQDRCTFKARDAQGKEYTVTGVRENLPAGTRGDPTATESGQWEMRTHDGQKVMKRIGERGRYYFEDEVGDEVDLTTDDTNAPEFDP